MSKKGIVRCHDVGQLNYYEVGFELLLQITVVHESIRYQYDLKGNSRQPERPSFFFFFESYCIQAIQLMTSPG